MAEQVAGAFALGSVRSAKLAARGWASLNLVWRIETSTGTWAVKEVTRESRDWLEAAAQIESSASQGGVPLPPIVPPIHGGVSTVIEGRVFRCHVFIKGSAPTVDLRREDAVAAGDALGRLHTLALPWEPMLMTAPHAYGAEHWAAMVEAGERGAASWAPALRLALPRVLETERAAMAWFAVPRRWIGSHRDVRPDNTVRSRDSLVLVDWDGAGPVVRGAEVAAALRWWAPHTDAFLAAYLDVAGDVDLNEGAGESGGLVWWLEMNVGHALAAPKDQERAWAVAALAANFGPASG